MGSIYLSIPNSEAAEKVIEWIKCSFQVEYVICAASLIYDRSLLLSQNKIEELSAIVIDAAQTYSAIAMELNILPSKELPARRFYDIDNSIFLEEQKVLAETGLEFFAENWKD